MTVFCELEHLSEEEDTRHCCSAAVAPSVDTQSLLLSPLLSLCCCAIVAPLSIRCRFCRSVAAAVPPDVATVSLLLSLLLSLTVVASRSRIRVTVFIGDCQARVSSSSERCSTSQKTVADVSPAVATQSHRYRSVVAPLLSRCRSGPERV